MFQRTKTRCALGYIARSIWIR